MDFTQPWDFGDVIFIVEGRKIYVNKGTLAMSSEVFRVMFTTEFKERKMTEIPLPDKKFDDFLQLMQILQPLSNKCVDNTNVESFLHLAHEYQIHQVVERCERFLVKQPPSIHNLILAHKFSLSELHQACIQYVKETPYSKIAEDPEFKMVDKEIVWEAFQHKLELHEGKDPLKNIVRKLMSEQPSIKNLFLAEKYDVPDVYEKCLKYVKDTPLKQLKQESGFTNLKPETLNEVLHSKVEKLELIVTKVSKLTTWGKLDQQALCSSCRRISGTNKDCLGCKGYRFEKTCEVMNKYS